MPNRLLILALVAALGVAACDRRSTPKAVGAQSLSATLTGLTESASERDSLGALFLLSQIEVDPVDIARIRKQCAVAVTANARLFCAYWRYQKLQEPEAATEFVRAFPSTSEALAALFNDTIAVPMPGSLIDLLHNLATTDDAALGTLIAASQVADGWVAETMTDAISDLEKINPDRVRGARRAAESGSHS